MNLVQRVKDILLKPKETWPVIEQEGADTTSLYTQYIVFLAAIPVVAGFIGFSLIGMGVFGTSVRVPIVAGLVQMVLSYIVSLAMLYVMSLVVDALAPTFGGTRSKINALKLMTYSSTAAFVGGIFNLLPTLAILGMLAALYSIYLVYTGITVLMKCPEEKALGYTAVVIVCAIVMALVVGAVAALFMPGTAMGPGMR